LIVGLDKPIQMFNSAHRRGNRQYGGLGRFRRWRLMTATPRLAGSAIPKNERHYVMKITMIGSGYVACFGRVSRISVMW